MVSRQIRVTLTSPHRPTLARLAKDARDNELSKESIQSKLLILNIDVVWISAGRDAAWRRRGRRLSWAREHRDSANVHYFTDMNSAQSARVLMQSRIVTLFQWGGADICLSTQNFAGLGGECNAYEVMNITSSMISIRVYDKNLKQPYEYLMWPNEFCK